MIWSIFRLIYLSLNRLEAIVWSNILKKTFSTHTHKTVELDSLFLFAGRLTKFDASFIQLFIYSFLLEWKVMCYFPMNNWLRRKFSMASSECVVGFFFFRSMNSENEWIITENMQFTLPHDTRWCSVRKRWAFTWTLASSSDLTRRLIYIQTVSNKILIQFHRIHTASLLIWMRAVWMSLILSEDGRARYPRPNSKRIKIITFDWVHIYETRQNRQFVAHPKPPNQHTVAPSSLPGLKPDAVIYVLPMVLIFSMPLNFGFSSSCKQDLIKRNVLLIDW